MLTLRLLAGLVAAMASGPALAKVHSLNWSGAVNSIQSAVLSQEIHVGDQISAHFSFDDALAAGPSVLPIGGGTYSNYIISISDFALSVGQYDVGLPSVRSTLTYSDNAFETDFVVISVDGLTGGPFGSSFATVQFQARGPTSALDGSGLGNGLPYERLASSLFLSFGGGSAFAGVFGDLTATEAPVPELSTWVEIVGGVGAVGCVLRRRRRPGEASSI